MSGMPAVQLLTLRQIGVMGNVAGTVAAATQLPVVVALPRATDALVCLRIDITGVTQAGTVSYQCSNGSQVEAGFAANDRVPCWIAFGGPLEVTIDNQQTTAVAYNVLYVGLTAREFADFVRCVG